MWNIDALSDVPRVAGRTPGGLAVLARVAGPFTSGAGEGLMAGAPDHDALWLRVEHARLKLLRGFEELLCLEGLHGVERLPHQIETVRRVLRHFRGGVLLADEVGLGKTIEAGLLVREYLLRGMVRRVLILVPAALVDQWHEELSSKFGLDFVPAPSGSGSLEAFWRDTPRVLASLSLAKSVRNFEAVSACPWDLVVVDEAHHCRNRSTRNWQLVNALQRKRMIMLTATPVQNDLMELYNLLTLLEPGHLKTETDFKRNYVRRGNPRDPQNRERLRALLGEVMIRNTRSLVNINLPPRHAQTFVIHAEGPERRLYDMLDTYLRRHVRGAAARQASPAPPGSVAAANAAPQRAAAAPAQLELFDGGVEVPARDGASAAPLPGADGDGREAGESLGLSRMRVTSLLMAAGSHPTALVEPLAELIEHDGGARPLLDLARQMTGSAAGCGASALSAKEARLLELLRELQRGKALVFANFASTLERLGHVLTGAGIPFSVFTGRQSAAEKSEAVEQLASRVPVMLCSEVGGEGHNLQFANTLVNFDLPWNPMRIEQRVGRIHRIGQTREVFIFNLCTAGSLEERILKLLHDKVRMFELVVGEVGSILGNLEGGDEFETLVYSLWREACGPAELDRAFEQLGESLVAAQERYLETKRLDQALFGDEYE